MLKKFNFLFLVLVLLISFRISGFAQNLHNLRLVTVTGVAEVRVVPDEIILNLGIETWNPILSEAKKENDNKIFNLIDFLKNQKIEEKHIQVDQINIEPRYGEQWEHKKFIGYFVRKNVVVTLRDISKFEEIISGVLEKGVNYVHGIQFQTTELRKFRDEARALAIKAAYEKAVALASELGQKVGRPHTIREGNVNWLSSYGSWWGGWRAGGMVQNVIQNSQNAFETESSIAPGQIKINADITVSFELE